MNSFYNLFQSQTPQTQTPQTQNLIDLNNKLLKSEDNYKQLLDTILNRYNNFYELQIFINELQSQLQNKDSQLNDLNQININKDNIITKRNTKS